MTIPNLDTFLAINTIGNTALSVLSDGRYGRVLASVSSAIYLVDQFDELCWLIPMDGPLHQRSIQVRSQLPWLKVGTQYNVEHHRVAFKFGETLDFEQAMVWKSPVMPPIEVLSMSNIYEHLRIVVDNLLKNNIPAGFGCLITPLIQSDSHDYGVVEGNINFGAARMAWPAVQGILYAASIGDNELWISCAKSLIGFGEGLTPSGDDFLGGFIFAIQLLLHYYPRRLKIPIRSYTDFIFQSKSLTNPISYTILKDHTGGHSIDSLHKLANGLLMGMPISLLLIYARQLISVGHSTGWDILSGFFAGVSTSAEV